MLFTQSRSNHRRRSLIRLNPQRRKSKRSLVTALNNTQGMSIDEFLTEPVINHYLAVTSTSFGFAVLGGLLYPPLQALCIAGLFYSTFPIWYTAYNAVFKERRFSMACVDSIMLPLGMFLGYAWAMSAGYMLYFVSEKLVYRAKNNSKQELVNLMGEQPRFVWVRSDDGSELQIAFELLSIGDIVIIEAGQTVTVDGNIVQGVATIDERMLTGESQPVEKQIGDRVMASTLILQGRIEVQVETAGTQTIAAQIGQVLAKTADFKTNVQLQGEGLGDKVALPMLALAGTALLTIGPAEGLAVIYTPLGGTLRLTSPLSVLGFLQQGIKQGILIKDGRALEMLREIDTVVFDKTGTLTEEQPNVGAIHVCGSLDKMGLLRLAAAAEQKQAHPIAQAILAAAEAHQLTLPLAEAAKIDLGFGLMRIIDGQSVQIGSQRFMQQTDVNIPQQIEDVQTMCSGAGFSLVYVAVEGILMGAIELHPTIRPEAPAMLDELRQRGLTTYIISGDREEPTRNLAEQLGIDHYFAETLPEDKANLIEQLQAQGKKVCFIGDGINDSIALKKANVPVSMSGATTVATDVAQVVLLDGTLKQFIPLLDLAAGLERNMQRNIVAASVPSAIVIGGAFLFHLGPLGAIIWYNVSLVTGVINASLPNIQNGRQNLLNRARQWRTSLRSLSGQPLRLLRSWSNPPQLTMRVEGATDS